MKYILSLLVFCVSFAKAQDYRTDVVVLDSVSKITTYYGGSKLIYVKDTATGGYFYLYQGAIAADGKDIVLGSNSSKWRRVLGSNVDYTVLQLPSYSALRTLPRFGLYKTFIVYANGVNNYFRYDSTDKTTADDTAMTIVGYGGARYKRIVESSLDVRWFGATGSDTTDDWYNLQRCINYAVYNDYKKIVFPGGTFYLSKGLLVWKDANNDGRPEFVNITIEGTTSAYAGASQNETVLYANNRNSFALGIEKGKGCIVKNINLLGTNQLTYSNATAWTDATTYIKDSQRVNAYSPYAGLVLDPFGDSLAAADRYPGFSSYYDSSKGNGGSTDCKFYNIVTNGFIAGIILTPNPTTQNNESHLFDGLWISNCRDGFVTTNSQERQVTVKNFKAWQNVKTVFRTYGYGANKGEPPAIDGGNVAGNVYQIFYFTGVGGYFPVVSIKNIYAESFYRIGYINAPTIGFKDCHFSFALTTDFGMKVQDYVYSGNATTFDNCILVFYNSGYSTPMNMVGGNFKFNNCYLSNPVGINLNQWTINNPEASYSNCRFYNTGKYFSDSYQWSESFGYKNYSGNKMVDNNDVNVTYCYPERYGDFNKHAVQYRKVTSKSKRWISLGVVSVTVSGDSATATVAVLANKTQFNNMLVFDSYQGSSGGTQAMRIKSIDGSGNIKFDRVVDRLASGSYRLWIEDYQALSQPYLFDYNGSVFTNVMKEEDTASSGSTLSTAVTYYHNGFPVTMSSVSAGGGTPTWGLPWSPISRGILSSYDYEEYGYTDGHPLTNSYFTPGVLFSEGSFYTNIKKDNSDSLILGYKCIKSGIKGSKLTPQFEIVYRTRNAGSGYKLALEASNQVKSLTAGFGLTIDSSTTNQINYKFDSATVFGYVVGKVVTEGTYTPTKYIIANLDSVSFTACNYQKIGNYIYVYGEVYTDPTSSNQDTEVDISLPIATAINYTYSLAGNGSAYAVGEAMRIYGDTSNYRAKLRFKSSDNAGHVFSFSFVYKLDTPN